MFLAYKMMRKINCVSSEQLKIPLHTATGDVGWVEEWMLGARGISNERYWLVLDNAAAVGRGNAGFGRLVVDTRAFDGIGPLQAQIRLLPPLGMWHRWRNVRWGLGGSEMSDTGWYSTMQRLSGEVQASTCNAGFGSLVRAAFWRRSTHSFARTAEKSLRSP